MRVVIIDGDSQDFQYIEEKLSAAFRAIVLIRYSYLREFLRDMRAGMNPSPSVIITETLLNLVRPSRDSEAQYDELVSHFPDIASNWNPCEGYARLIRHLRAAGTNVPVVLFTASDRELLDASILEDPFVEYCPKDVLSGEAADELVRAIRKHT